ncbi:embryonic stem cell-specific 5-hydroxymethylcytosine-binding protein isoform X1 [Ooceraea biroi]|uniref:embryonic stem cell-specific 5-hydroxymethylcytosine-binding protein isoform X1 n=2 Tax=Ooceraea biroi TaxID=2015173 RepID=UPI000F0784D2|nr:embryonic stem cell-specific 5-hydroxymethylcytosine-binding protein isoform X1 [Ooceraea biroi]
MNEVGGIDRHSSASEIESNMCGRVCCALEPDTLCCVCEYKDANNKLCKPTWTDTELKYNPSCNMGPQDILPCIVSGSHFEEEDGRVLCAMIWGLIPPWHQGNYKKRSDKLSTHNGRLESIQTSKLYLQSLQRRQRCIVVCEGYYEWKAAASNKSSKQPYYIYAAQDEGVKADDPTTWSNELSEIDGWKGFKVLKLAGIFGTYKTEKGKVIHSCTIITKASNESLSWLHHRMPVYLNNEEECQVWLNKDLPTDAAVKMLNNLALQEGTLKWHPISTTVNNVHHKTTDCRKEIQPKEEKKNSQASFMASWLQKGSTGLSKRKSTDNKNTNTGKEEDEAKASKIQRKKI